MKSIVKKTAAAVLSAAAAVTAATSLALRADIVSSPVISRNVPAYCEVNPSSASSANDEHYFSLWYSNAPDYIAYDLSGVPEEQRKKVIAVWYNTSSYDQIGNYKSRNAEPSDYTIEVNTADGGAFPESGWQVVETVSDNSLSSRQHLIDLEGFNWIRMNISKSDGKEGGSISLNFDVHDVSSGSADSWIFFGDSITAGGMNNCYGTGFATYVNQLDSRYFPVQENGGIGGITSTDGKENIDRWLSDSPATFVSIAYGTNDAWGNQTGAQRYYENTKYMVDAIISAGKKAVLPKIPYSTNPDVNAYLDDYNAMIEKLWSEYPQIIKGADFDEYFRENPDMLSGDGVHPSSEGYDNMRRLWAETMYERVYKSGQPEQPMTSEETTAPQSSVIVYGDADLDGEVTINDVVKLLCHTANPNTNPLDDDSIYNADVYQRGDGINVLDAFSVQKFLASMINELPES